MTMPAPPPSARILVSEDDPIQAAVIAAILEQEGYQVETRGTLCDTRAAVRACGGAQESEEGKPRNKGDG